MVEEYLYVQSKLLVCSKNEQGPVNPEDVYEARKTWLLRFEMCCSFRRQVAVFSKKKTIELVKP
jgi:hypothetical protein